MIDYDGGVLAAAQAAFGEQVLYLPGVGGALTISGIFDAHWQEEKFVSGMSVIETRPVLNVRESTLPQPPVQGELLRIRGRLYAIAEPPEADTMGDIRLFLRLANDAQAAIAATAPVAP